MGIPAPTGSLHDKMRRVRRRWALFCRHAKPEPIILGLRGFEGVEVVATCLGIQHVTRIPLVLGRAVDIFTCSRRRRRGMLHVVKRINNEFESVTGHDINVALDLTSGLPFLLLPLLKRDKCRDIVPLFGRVIMMLADLKSPGGTTSEEILKGLRVNGELRGAHGEMTGSVADSRQSRREDETVGHVLKFETAGDCVDTVLEQLVLGYAAVNKHKEWAPGLLGPRYRVGQLLFKTRKGALHGFGKLLHGARSAELKCLPDTINASTAVWPIQVNLVRPFLFSVHIGPHHLLMIIKPVQHFLERFGVDLDSLELLHDGSGSQPGNVELPLLAASRGAYRVGYPAIMESVVCVSV